VQNLFLVVLTYVLEQFKFVISFEFCLLEQPEAGEDPEFVRAKYFFRDEFLVTYFYCCFLVILLISSCYSCYNFYMTKLSVSHLVVLITPF